jgi:membrane-bound metal-dependent hydrolase YbcI (DUF457 family)
VGTQLDLALLFTISVLPDFDFLLFTVVKHREPSHSLLFLLLVCLPFFVVYRKKVLPYFVALLSHSLLGDMFAGGTQLFWPFSTDTISISHLYQRGTIIVSLELGLFVASAVVMTVNGDFQRLLFIESNRGYSLLAFGMVLGPLLIGTIHPYQNLPLLLVVPSLFYLAIFSYSIIGLGHKKDDT